VARRRFPPPSTIFGAAIVALLVGAWVWAELACDNPAWQKVLNGSPSCTEFWLNRYQGLIGALATLFAGFLAYRAALSEMRRAERQARVAREAALHDQIQQLCLDIDGLKLAASYLGKYTEPFPTSANATKVDYFTALQSARIMARDFVSHTAASAPYGYGPRIQTIMTSIQQLGERIKEQLESAGANYQSTVDLYGSEIVDRITGLRSVRDQLRAEIPRREDQLIALRNELAMLQSNRSQLAS
jgi:hypothetical protein